MRVLQIWWQMRKPSKKGEAAKSIGLVDNTSDSERTVKQMAKKKSKREQQQKPGLGDSDGTTKLVAAPVTKKPLAAVKYTRLSNGILRQVDHDYNPKCYFLLMIH